MKSKAYLLLISLLLLHCWVFGQATIRPLYNLTILKSTNVESKRIDKFIEIDSLGNLYSEHKKTKSPFNIKAFTKEVNRYVTEQNIEKYPGNNDIYFTELPTPALNKQAIVIEVKFLDDVRNEKDLRNKTYYSWGNTFDKDNNEYPIFKYLTETEVKILKALLE